MILVALAAACSGLFAGAAAYINFVEHPARLESGTVVAVAEFRPSYRRATVMQASLAIAAATNGFAGWLEGGNSLVLIGTLFMASVIPYTFATVFPTNKRLLDPGLDPASQEAARLLGRWAALHAVRTVLAAFAFFAFLYALSEGT